MWSNVLTLAGAIGAALVIVAYFCTQQGWLQSDDRRYLLANLAGAALILLSLHAEWNLPSAIIEGFWLAISLFGLAKTRRKGFAG